MRYVAMIALAMTACSMDVEVSPDHQSLELPWTLPMGVPPFCWDSYETGGTWDSLGRPAEVSVPFESDLTFCESWDGDEFVFYVEEGGTIRSYLGEVSGVEDPWSMYWFIKRPDRNAVYVENEEGFLEPATEYTADEGGDWFVTVGWSWTGLMPEPAGWETVHYNLSILVE